MQDAIYGDAVYLGDVQRRDLDEISGMACSRRESGLLWLIDDQSRNLFAIDHRGADLGSVRVLDRDGRRVANRDREDLASFAIDDGLGAPRAYLAIADSGGSGSEYRSRDRGPDKRDSRVFEVQICREPERPTAATAALGLSAVVEWRLRFCVAKQDYAVYRDAEQKGEANTWEGEAMAVDADAGVVLLMSKPVRKEIPACLWALPLRPAAGEEVVYLEKLTEVRSLPRLRRESAVVSAKKGARGDVPTALDLRAGRELFVQTDRHAYLYLRREARESWAQVVERQPIELKLPPMRQPEALAVDPESGDVFVTSEQDGAPSPIFCLRRG